MSVQHVDIVHGKHLARVPVAELLARASVAGRVLVDLGAGDGRFAYRLARAHADWLCVAVDACGAGMRELSWRAERKPSRGGAPNAVFVRAEVASLPDALDGIADELTVHYPWGCLLRGVLEADPALLGRIVRLGRPGAALRIRVNQSALGAAGMGEGLDQLLLRFRQGFGAAGVRLAVCGRVPAHADTSWGARVRGGRPAWVLAIDGTLIERMATPWQRRLTPGGSSNAV